MRRNKNGKKRNVARTSVRECVSGRGRGRETEIVAAEQPRQRHHEVKTSTYTTHGGLTLAMTEQVSIQRDCVTWTWNEAAAVAAANQSGGLAAGEIGVSPAGRRDPDETTTGADIIRRMIEAVTMVMINNMVKVGWLMRRDNHVVTVVAEIIRHRLMKVTTLPLVWLAVVIICYYLLIFVIL